MKVLVVYYRNKTTFIQRDIDILSKHYQVDDIAIRKKGDFWTLARKVRSADVVFIWFAGKHAGISVFLSKLFRKKSIVVVGGYDAAKVPDINYGLWETGSFWDKYLARYSLKNADKVLVVDPSLKKDIIKNARIKGDNIEWVPTGYDYTFWKPGGKKENMVITVAAVKRNNIKRKGLETFVKAAKYFPDVKFVLIGKFMDESIDYLKSIASPNVEFTGYISTEELLKYYQRAKVYCQLSRYEGLPNALCEAMLCGCIPVGTRHNGIPTAIGDTGFYVKYGDIEDTVEGIKKALKSNEAVGMRARKRIIAMFPMERREKNLVRILNSLKRGVQ